MIQNILLTSLFCMGLCKAFDEGFIFGFIDKWLQKKIPAKQIWILKPFYLCPPCMASVWGLTAFFIFYGTIDLRVIPFIFCVSGLNWLLSSIAE